MHALWIAGSHASRTIEYEIDAEVDREFGAMRALRVTVRLKNGSSYQQKVDY